jgi:nitroimidazol reductase NimA-like FMN-containing flavoprotein (pyridoxamine 5'-phosphate oxidase superfamily)
MIGMLSPVEIETFLRRQRVGRICSAVDDRPYVALVHCIYNGLHLYGWMEPARLIASMRAQPHVCVQVDEITGQGNWCSVIAEGIYEEIADPVRRRAILAELGFGPDAAAPPPESVLFRIRLVTKSGRFGRDASVG